MEKMTIKEIAEALGCPYGEERDITSLCTDSREAGEGALFVALPGERVNGHDYINKALAAGAAYAVAEEPGEYEPMERVLAVKSSLRAILEIAACYRKKFSARVIGITGSVGKTTTKEMVAAVMESAFCTLKTEGNQNNEIGAPKTLLRLEPETEVAVIEMGMSDFGEIRDLCYAARPMMGIITNIGVSHIERLGSRENILKAKMELAEALPDGSPLILSADDDFLRDVDFPRLHVVRYALHHPADFTARIIESRPDRTDFVITAEGQEYPASLPGTGEHLIKNALAAFAAGRLMGIPAEQAIAALGNYAPSGMRQRMEEHRGVTLVEDCYNASPESMRAALMTLRDFPARSRKVFVAADMLELGAITEESHREVGRLAARYRLDALFTWGEAARFAAEEAKQEGLGEVFHFERKKELAAALMAYAKPGDVLWFKASHGMALEEVIRWFKENDET